MTLDEFLAWQAEQCVHGPNSSILLLRCKATARRERLQCLVAAVRAS